MTILSKEILAIKTFAFILTMNLCLILLQHCTTLLFSYQHAIVLLQLFEFGLLGVKRKLLKTKGVFSISVFVFWHLESWYFP